jgi:hypothetical protein
MSYPAEKMEQGTMYHQTPEAVAVTGLTPVAVDGSAAAATGPVVVSGGHGGGGVPMHQQEKLGGKCCEFAE